MQEREREREMKTVTRYLETNPGRQYYSNDIFGS
jgi:hypothetical protein